ncbi:MAG: NADAR family protein [Alistipes sp.]|nr:NADAR family protein [Alistipes sp.]
MILFNSYSIIGTEVLSNLHVCRLEYEGRIFHSSEQLFYWLRLTGYPEHQEALLQCATPKEVKKLGEKFMKKLGIADDLKRDVPLLRLAIRVKYNCCTHFKTFLDTHPNQCIVEYAWWGDNEYGCVDDDRWLKYDWTQGYVTGKNLCGRIIKGVRDEPKDENGKCIITRPACLDTMRPLTLFS